MSTSKTVRIILLSAVLSCLTGCEDPQIYGSVGISSGYGGYGGYGYRGGYSPRVNTSISVGGRIR
jgi:hypothetical protein